MQVPIKKRVEADASKRRPGARFENAVLARRGSHPRSKARCERGQQRGKKPATKDLVEEHGDQLKDAFSSALSSKTATDLERPGARNLIRSELITIANGILGEGVVVDLYFTEFATQ